MIYKFFWDDGKEEVLIEILGTTSMTFDSIKQETIEKLLNEYRENNEDYNIDGWCEFLEKHGYNVSKLEPDCSMYF